MLLTPAVPCPLCGEASDLDQPIFTAWGGVLWPRLVHHTICGTCGRQYNGRTGASNRRVIGAIVLANVAGAALLLGLLVALVVLSSL